jgi:adenylate cyclase
VQALLHQAVREGLRRCGGYLCRVQEGDLRFMVAFASPVAALEWCLVVQEAAMYLPWPTEPVLLYEGCTVERDEKGHIVFRGPRIKMGVCEWTDGRCRSSCELCVL